MTDADPVTAFFARSSGFRHRASNLRNLSYQHDGRERPGARRFLAGKLHFRRPTGLGLNEGPGVNDLARPRRAVDPFLRPHPRAFVSFALRPPIELARGTPREGLDSRVGSWPSPALLESGPGFGEAGRWSILAAHPPLVFEATGPHWAIRDDGGGAESGTGDVLGALAGLIRRFGLADPVETPD